MTKDHILTRLCEVYSNPLTLAASFLPDCMADKVEDVMNVPAQFDHRTSEFLNKTLERFQADYESLAKLMDCTL